MVFLFYCYLRIINWEKTFNFIDHSKVRKQPLIYLSCYFFNLVYFSLIQLYSINSKTLILDRYLLSFLVFIGQATLLVLRTCPGIDSQFLVIWFRCSIVPIDEKVRVSHLVYGEISMVCLKWRKNSMRCESGKDAWTLIARVRAATLSSLATSLRTLRRKLRMITQRHLVSHGLIWIKGGDYDREEDRGRFVSRRWIVWKS